MNKIPIIQKNKANVLILPHTMPDGDTIGSSVALFFALRQLGHTPYVVLDDALPQEIAFLNENIISTMADIEKHQIQFDLVMTVDMSDLERLRERRTLCEGLPLWNIDHHSTNSLFGDEVLLDTGASSTGEIIYDMIISWGLVVTPQMAQALYVAIATDTGSFKYQSTTAKTHKIIAALYEVGFDHERVMMHLYHNQSHSKIRLHALALQNLQYFKDKRVALAVVSLRMLEETQATETESDGLVEAIRDISGIEAVVLLKEKATGEIKISMRSLGDINVATIAHQHGGGGHPNAAGFSIKDTLEKAILYVSQVIEKQVLI